VAAAGAARSKARLKCLDNGAEPMIQSAAHKPSAKYLTHWTPSSFSAYVRSEVKGDTRVEENWNHRTLVFSFVLSSGCFGGRDRHCHECIRTSRVGNHQRHCRRQQRGSASRSTRNHHQRSDQSSPHHGNEHQRPVFRAFPGAWDLQGGGLEGRLRECGSQRPGSAGGSDPRNQPHA
jgi:hypothetical protein